MDDLGQPVLSTPVLSTPTQSKPAESKPAQSKPAESKLALSKANRRSYIAGAMVEAEKKPPRRVRLGAAVVVAALHLVGVAVLIRAFAPQLGSTILQPVTQAFDVVITSPMPEPPPRPARTPAPAKIEGAAAAAGRKAQPREITAPITPVVLPSRAAPLVASTGAANSAGATDVGQGTGAKGTGTGTGSGAAGSGSGGGGAAKAVKLSGDIVSARDYPKDSRALRLGSAVTIALTVGTDGRVSDCRVVRASRDAEADRITCRLATERFRFRPARDPTGQPVASIYGWQQRWFTPEPK